MLPSTAEVGHVSLTPTLKMFININKITSEFSFLKTEQAQLAQPFLTGQMLQDFHHPCGPPLDPLQMLHILPVLDSSKLDAVVQLRPHKGRTEGGNQFPCPAAHLSSDNIQDTIDLLGL